MFVFAFGPSSSLCVPHASPAPGRIRPRLEGVVLGSNLLDEVVTDDGELLQNVLSYTGNVAKEEEGEDAGDGAEAGCGGATVVSFTLVSGPLLGSR